MTETRKLRVFLCHSSQDKPIVPQGDDIRELYQRLNAEGWIDPWLDGEKLLPGQDWDLEIENGVSAKIGYKTTGTFLCQ
ncbi:MAG: toll/interleukin-1 receptor domain-containing protein [Chloroflexota bacterium]